MTIVLQIFFDSLDCFSMLLAALAFFSIDIKPIWYKLAFIALPTGMLSVYFTYNHQYNYLILPFYYVLLVLSFVLILNLPVFYSMLMLFTGAIVLIVLQNAAAFLFNAAELDMKEAAWLGYARQSVVFSIMLSLTQWMNRRKIGFLFISRRIRFNFDTKGYNFMLMLLIILSLIVLQIGTIYSSGIRLPLALLAILIIVFLLVIGITYTKNKEEILERLEKKFGAGS